MKTEPEEMALEYRFDYSKAKPNRFAEGMKPGWTVEWFVGEERTSSPKAKAAAKAKKTKPLKKPVTKKTSKPAARKKKK